MNKPSEAWPVAVKPSDWQQAFQQFLKILRPMNCQTKSSLMWPWSRKMNAVVAEKCLAFFQELVRSNHKFSFNLSVGKDNFVFNNKELAQSSWKRKTKSPSQIRRETRRWEARQQKMAEEDTDKVSDPEKSKSENLLNKCNHCEMSFNSEKRFKDSCVQVPQDWKSANSWKGADLILPGRAQPHSQPRD